MAMGRNKNYLDNIEPIARALASGLSLQGAGEALSIGAAAAYLSTSYGNPMDSHLHTGTYAYLSLLDVFGMPAALDQVLAAGSDTLGEALARSAARQRAGSPRRAASDDEEWEI